METTRQPANAKERADEIGDLISSACEKLILLSKEWFELNDPVGLTNARKMLDANEILLMLSVHQEKSGLAHVALHLLRTEYPMPRPFFEVCVPMLRATLDQIDPRPQSERGRQDYDSGRQEVPVVDTNEQRPPLRQRWR